MAMVNDQPQANQRNGKGPLSGAAGAPNPQSSSTNLKNARQPKSDKFEHPLMLQQSSFWSRAILWTLMGVATSTVIWACFAKIEEAIPAQGKLEPQGNVKEVQVPVSGVVKTVFVKDGQRVKQGDVLLQIDPTVSQSQLNSLKQVRQTLIQENQFYQAQFSGSTIASASLKVPSQFLSLSRNRAAFVSESQLFRAELDGQRAGLTAAQQERLQSNQTELSTRFAAARLQADQLARQLTQTQVRLEAARKALALNQKILRNITPLAETGAISQVQYLKQQQEVDTNQSEVDQLLQEQERIQYAIAQADAQAQNTVAVDRKDLTARLAENEKRIAEIDSQFTKAIVENNKRISEIDSQISQAQQTLQYAKLRSPVDGIVFDLKAGTPGFVANPTEPVMKIVPEDSLIAKVSITNQDIGFVREGMVVDVRIDSFPFSEFGDVKGTLIWIGSDALPPTQIQPHYTFPAKIRLERQSLRVNGREVRLQSGMSLSANIKLRQRSVMSIFLDQFTKAADSFKFVR